MNGRLMKMWDEYPEMLRREKMYAKMLEQMPEEDFEGELRKVQDDPIMSQNAKEDIASRIRQRQLAHFADLETYRDLLRQYRTELAMFEAALDTLPAQLRDVAKELAVGEISWDAIAEKHYISRTTLSHYRKQILNIMSEVYDRHDQAEIERLLS